MIVRGHTTLLTGICGGIGAGKSVVSRLLRLRGFRVYDCDLEARRLMESDAPFKEEMRRRFGPDIYSASGQLDRAKLAGHIFAGDEARQWVNSRVHAMVRDHLRECVAQCDGRMWVESAILASSGLAEMCGEVWLVTAPHAMRVERVALRSGLDPAAIEARMRSQADEEVLLRNCGVPVREIPNDGRTSVIARVDALLARDAVKKPDS